MSSKNHNYDFSSVIQRFVGFKNTFQKFHNFKTCIGFMNKFYPKFIFKCLKKFYSRSKVHLPNDVKNSCPWNGFSQALKVYSIESPVNLNTVELNYLKEIDTIIAEDREKYELPLIWQLNDHFHNKVEHTLEDKCQLQSGLEDFQIRCMRVMQYLQDHRKLTSKNYYMFTNLINNLHEIKNQRQQKLSNHNLILTQYNMKKLKVSRSRKKKYIYIYTSLKHFKLNALSHFKARSSKISSCRKDLSSVKVQKSEIIKDLKKRIEKTGQFQDLTITEINRNSPDAKQHFNESDDESIAEIEKAIQKITDTLIVFEERARARAKIEKRKEKVKLLIRDDDTD